MSWDLNRRQLLYIGGAARPGAGAMGRVLAQPKGDAKKVLFFTKSSGFQHSVITRHGDKPAHAERILAEIGKEHGFEVVASKDGRLFEPDQIGQWDAFAFETTGDLTTPGTDKSPPISPDGEKALYDAIKAGKGFVGMHCATDTFGHHHQRNKGADDPFIQMIGGEFAGHGPVQQEVRIDIADSDSRALQQDSASPASRSGSRTNGMPSRTCPMTCTSSWFRSPKGCKARCTIVPTTPRTWARAYGKGRVFYTSMGHREDVWENPMYQGLLLGALAWATGRVEASIEPNITRVTPNYNQLPT